MSKLKTALTIFGPAPLVTVAGRLIGFGLVAGSVAPFVAVNFIIIIGMVMADKRFIGLVAKPRASAEWRSLAIAMMRTMAREGKLDLSDDAILTFAALLSSMPYRPRARMLQYLYNLSVYRVVEEDLVLRPSTIAALQRISSTSLEKLSPLERSRLASALKVAAQDPFFNSTIPEFNLWVADLEAEAE